MDAKERRALNAIGEAAGDKPAGPWEVTGPARETLIYTVRNCDTNEVATSTPDRYEAYRVCGEKNEEASNG